MPQMIIEYSDNIQNLDKEAMLVGLNHALFDTGLVHQPADIKSRIRENSDFLIGFGEEPQAYIHVRLAIMSGRSDDQKNIMADRLSGFLQGFEAYEAKGLTVQLCVEIAEMPKEHYRKVKVQK
jgi:5-carboxymethyl-2-hydroxymuconate isomerase